MIGWRSGGAAALAIVLGGTAALAALPPYHQRVAAIEAVIRSAEVARALEGKGPIDSVARVGEDNYVVEAGRCSLRVRIVSTGARGDPPGPRRFRLEVGAPRCP